MVKERFSHISLFMEKYKLPFTGIEFFYQDKKSNEKNPYPYADIFKVLNIYQHKICMSRAELGSGMYEDSTMFKEDKILRDKNEKL